MIGMNDIVVIDDDPVDLDITLSVCRTALPHCTVHGLSEVNDAETCVAKHNPPMVLVDHFLGHTNGIDLITDMQHRFPTTAFVLLTGSDDLNLGLQALRAGACEYLQKGDLSTEIIIELTPKILATIRYRQANDALLWQLDIGLVQLDAQLCIERCNGWVELLLKESAASLHGQALAKRLPREDFTALQSIMQLVGNESSQPMETSLIDSNGTPRPVNLIVTSVHTSGGCERFTLVLRHPIINERPQALSMLAGLFNTDDAIGLTDLQGNLQFLNPTARQDLGLTLASTMPANFQEFLPESFNNCFVKTILSCIQTQGVWSGGVVLRLHSHPKLVELTIVPVESTNKDYQFLGFTWREVAKPLDVTAH